MGRDSVSLREIHEFFQPNWTLRPMGLPDVHHIIFSALHHLALHISWRPPSMLKAWGYQHPKTLLSFCSAAINY